MLEKERDIEGLIRGIRIEVLLLSRMIVKQEKERKLVKGFSSGKILEGIGKIVVTLASMNHHIQASG